MSFQICGNTGLERKLRNLPLLTTKDCRSTVLKRGFGFIIHPLNGLLVGQACHSNCQIALTHPPDDDVEVLAATGVVFQYGKAFVERWQVWLPQLAQKATPTSLIRRRV